MLDDIPDDAVLGLHPNLRVRLESYRLHRYLDDGSLPHLALGRDVDALIDRFNAMVALHDSGVPDWFARSHAGDIYTRAGENLRLRDEFYFDPPTTLLDPDLHVVLRWHGEARRIAIPANGPTLLALRELFPLLVSGRTVEWLRRNLGDEEIATLDSLRAAGALAVLEHHAPTDARTARMTLVGHSCLLVESERTRLLIDPVLSVRHRSAINLLPVLRGGIDAVAISHPHWDHFNPDTLALVDPSVRMLVPACVHRRSLVNVDLVPLCRELGFRHVTALRSWDRVEIGDIAVTALPYHGEGSGPEGVQDWMTYAVEVNGRLLIGVVDACRDDFGSMDDVLRQARAKLGCCDVLLSPCSDFRFSRRHFHRRPFTLTAGKEQFTGSAADTLRWADITGASAIVPYAEFYFDAEDIDKSQPGPGQEGSWRDLAHLAPAATASRLTLLRPGESLPL
jgi:L-ascorbate metabolism protein UlaG (beta-lactamase superfamily)